MKRTIDILFSLILILALSPLFLLVAIIVYFENRENVIFSQVRVGKQGQLFFLLKFKTMIDNANNAGYLTIGSTDSRITKSGKVLRKYKIDELPQLFNVLKGDMSLVGPRPEVPFFVNLYNPIQMEILDVRPGITDYASIKYFSENDLIAEAEDPTKYYSEVIMQDKLNINLEYVYKRHWYTDIVIVYRTVIILIKKMFTAEKS